MEALFIVHSTDDVETIELKSDERIESEQALWTMDDDLNVIIKFKQGDLEGKKVKLPLCYMTDISTLYRAYELLQPKRHRSKYLLGKSV